MKSDPKDINPDRNYISLSQSFDLLVTLLGLVELSSFVCFPLYVLPSSLESVMAHFKSQPILFCVPYSELHSVLDDDRDEMILSISPFRNLPPIFSFHLPSIFSFHLPPIFFFHLPPSFSFHLPPSFYFNLSPIFTSHFPLIFSFHLRPILASYLASSLPVPQSLLWGLNNSSHPEHNSSHLVAAFPSRPAPSLLWS